MELVEYLCKVSKAALINSFYINNGLESLCVEKESLVVQTCCFVL